MPQALYDQIAAAANSASCELLHVEFKGNVLRVILDHPKGVTLDHCERVSRQASAVLDAEDFGTSRYMLEVSSPGLDRELYRSEDYERFVGRSIRVTFTDAESGAKRTLSGRLESYDPRDGGRATVVAHENGEELVLPRERIKRAKLEIEL